MAAVGAGALQQLNAKDAEWRRLLSGVSLVAEADIEPGEVRPVLLALGDRYRRLYDPYQRPTERDKRSLLSRWPSCLAVGMSQVAATGYEEGTFWRKMWGAIDFEPSHGDQGLWGQAFIESLGKLGLPVFPEVRGHRFVAQILMHSGIPTSCLKDLLDMLVEHARRDPGLDAASYVRWATGGTNRMNRLDKPVRHLIEYGGEYAYDLIDRLLELLDRLRDPHPDLWGIGLPDRLVDKTNSLATSRQIGLPSGARRTSQHRVAAKPRLGLDPFGEGPRLLLPGTSKMWRVTVDGRPQDVRATPAWPGEEVAETSFPLDRPAKHVQVQSASEGEVTAITVFREDEPLLVFTEDGEFIPHGRPLPSAPVWVLCPEDRKLEDGIRVISDAYLPFGWEEWTLQEVDLENATRLALVGGPVRDVSAAGAPRLLLPPEPLAGVTAAHRQPVYHVAPLISLPKDTARSWHIEVRQVDKGASANPIRRRAGSGQIDPWDELPRPVIGTFDVSIVGPLGFRFYRRLAVAEGLAATYEPALRLFSGTGLEPAEATLAGEAALSETRLSFGEDRVERAITYGGTGLVVSPPHMSVLHDSAQGNSGWSAKPVRLTAESLAQTDPGWLLLRMPGVERLPWLQIVGNEVTQIVRPYGAHHPGQARFRLNLITDTVRAVRRLDASIQVRDRLVPVAHIRPRQLATGAVREGQNLRLTGCVFQPGLHVGIYTVYEPWRKAEVLPVSDKGRVILPSALRTIGSLRVLPAMRDRGGSWPYWPSADDSFLVPGAVADADNHQAARFVAGRGECPEHIDDEHVWELLAIAEELESDGARKDLHGQCDMRLRSYPVPALLALARTRLAPAAALVEMILVGLAGQRVRGLVALNDARLMWGRLRAPAALLSSAILADPGQAAELVDLIDEDHGAAVRELLLGDADPYQGSGEDESPALSDAGRVTDVAVEVLKATPYHQLVSRIHARPEGAAKASAAFALGMRAAAHAGIRRDFRGTYRASWAELAKSHPDLVSLDIIAAQAAISAIDRRSRVRRAS